MTPTDLLNLIWGKAFLDFNLNNYGVVKSTFDFDNCNCRICDEFLEKYQSKSGVLAEYVIEDNNVSIILDPDYFYSAFSDPYQDNFIYRKIENVFDDNNWLNIKRIKIVEAEMKFVS